MPGRETPPVQCPGRVSLVLCEWRHWSAVWIGFGLVVALANLVTPLHRYLNRDSSFEFRQRQLSNVTLYASLFGICCLPIAIMLGVAIALRNLPSRSSAIKGVVIALA